MESAWKGKLGRTHYKQAKELPLQIKADFWDDIIALLEKKLNGNITHLINLITSGGGGEHQAGGLKHYNQKGANRRANSSSKQPPRGASIAVHPFPVGASACAEPTAPTQPNPAPGVFRGVRKSPQPPEKIEPSENGIIPRKSSKNPPNFGNFCQNFDFPPKIYYSTPQIN